MNVETSLISHPVAPRIERVRHALKRRSLVVRASERLTPGMLRITLTGEDLVDFTSLAPDDHIKIIVPTEAGEQMRDYTPRRFDAGRRELIVDFAVHEAGPATAWALAAAPGDRLDIAGPRGSAVIAPEGLRWLLIGDETALPAIGRRIEEAAPSSEVIGLVAVTGPEEHQVFETAATLSSLWVHRPLAAAADASPLLAALEGVTITPDTFIWIAAEASVTRALRAYLTGTRGVPLAWTKAAGYWVMGQADAHEKF